MIGANLANVACYWDVRIVCHNGTSAKSTSVMHCAQRSVCLCVQRKIVTFYRFANKPDPRLYKALQLCRVKNGRSAALRALVQRYWAQVVNLEGPKVCVGCYLTHSNCTSVRFVSSLLCCHLETLRSPRQAKILYVQRI